MSWAGPNPKTFHEALGAAGHRDGVRGAVAQPCFWRKPHRLGHRLGAEEGDRTELCSQLRVTLQRGTEHKGTRGEALVGERTGREKGKCPWPRRGLPAPARTLAAPPAGAQNSHLDGCGVHVTSSAAGTSSGLLWAPQAFLVLQRPHDG